MVSVVDYHKIRSYCPVNNIEKQKYAHVLVKAEFNDISVNIAGSIKYVALLNENNTDAHSTQLLYVNLTAGHHGVMDEKYKFMH